MVLNLFSCVSAMWRSGVCNMGFLLLPFILSLAFALPNQDPPAATRPSCIKMTPEKEKQIDEIVEKLGNFLANNLTIEHEHFDIRLIKLSIEQHFENEVDEKETMLQLSVNDCQLSEDELEEIDHHKEKARQHELERKEKEIQAREKAKPEEHNEEDQLKDEKGDESKPNFKVMNLDLDENGNRLVKILYKRQPKRPLLVYVQKDEGQLDYVFYKRR